MAKRKREVGADADTPPSEDMLKASYALVCKAYVSVSIEVVSPAGDQLKHHALWVRSLPRCAPADTYTQGLHSLRLPFVRSGRMQPAGSSSPATASWLRTRG